MINKALCEYNLFCYKRNGFSGFGGVVAIDKNNYNDGGTVDDADGVDVAVVIIAITA